MESKQERWQYSFKDYFHVCNGNPTVKIGRNTILTYILSLDLCYIFVRHNPNVEFIKQQEHSWILTDNLVKSKFPHITLKSHTQYTSRNGSDEPP